MATLSTVAVDFIANVSKYISGLTRMKEENKKFSSDTKKEFSKAKGGIDDFSNGLAGGLKGLRVFGAALGGIGEHLYTPPSENCATGIIEHT